MVRASATFTPSWPSPAFLEYLYEQRLRPVVLHMVELRLTSLEHRHLAPTANREVMPPGSAVSIVQMPCRVARSSRGRSPEKPARGAHARHAAAETVGATGRSWEAWVSTTHVWDAARELITGLAAIAATRGGAGCRGQPTRPLRSSCAWRFVRQPSAGPGGQLQSAKPPLRGKSAITSMARRRQPAGMWRAGTGRLRVGQLASSIGWWTARCGLSYMYLDIHASISLTTRGYSRSLCDS